jgi:hypothetical protein
VADAVYHLEMRMGLTVMRVFNQSPAELQARFLAPMQRGEAFTFEEHQWIPREMRVSIWEGPKLATHQLTMGRGWQNACRTGTEVTEQVLAQAGLGRGKGATGAAPLAPLAGDAVADGATGSTVSGSTFTGSDLPAGASGALRERTIGRLSAGPASLTDILWIAAELLPERRPDEVLAVAVDVVRELLDAGRAELESDGKPVTSAVERATLVDDIRSWLDHEGYLLLSAVH